jgi:tRNA(Ile)-lysidine synthase
MKKEWGEGLRVDLCSLATSAQRLQRQADALSSALSSAHAVKVEAGRVEAEQAWLRRLPPAILPDLLQRWLKQGGLWSRTLTARQYDEVAALLRHGRGAVALPGSALACLHRGRFIIRRNLRRRAPGFAAQLAAPGVTPIDPARGYLEAKVLEGGKELVENRRLTRDRFEEFLDLEKLHLPLGVRFLRPGDRMKPLGAPGTRKLQDILTDLHVPAWQRPDTLVVTMNDKPIWIVGVRIADAVKLTHTTRKVLRLRFVRTK